MPRLGFGTWQIEGPDATEAVRDALLADLGLVPVRAGGVDLPVADLPKASSHERRVENFEIFDFSLSDGERERIDALPKDDRQIDPAFGPDWEA